MTNGTRYWINIAYSYVLLFVGAVLICILIQTLTRPSHLYLGQACAFVSAPQAHQTD
jgi:hypothetical protein